MQSRPFNDLIHGWLAYNNCEGTIMTEEEIFSRITVNPNICHGKPVIKGTRILISIILGLMAEGYSYERIINFYPQLVKEDIQAAVEYAKALIEEEVVYPIEVAI